nr:MAG TPA: hypothetical protein [Caudoviricetes sp.]
MNITFRYTLRGIALFTPIYLILVAIIILIGG